MPNRRRTTNDIRWTFSLITFSAQTFLRFSIFAILISLSSSIVSGYRLLFEITITATVGIGWINMLSVIESYVYMLDINWIPAYPWNEQFTRRWDGSFIRYELSLSPSSYSLVHMYIYHPPFTYSEFQCRWWFGHYSHVRPCPIPTRFRPGLDVYALYIHSMMDVMGELSNQILSLIEFSVT